MSFTTVIITNKDFREDINQENTFIEENDGIRRLSKREKIVLI